MRIYLSGGITNVPDYMDNFDRAQREIEQRGHEVVNPARILSGLPETTTWKEYMIVCTSLMSICDGIYLISGWQRSKGAKIEAAMAQDAGLSIIT